MKMKTIKTWSSQENCTKYLYRTWPTKFIEDKALCLKMDDVQAARVSECLKLTGIEHEIIEVEGNH